MPMEYIVPSLRVSTITEITDVEVVEERLLQLIHLEDFTRMQKSKGKRYGTIDTLREIILKS